MYTRIGIVVFEMGASDLHNIASFRNYLSGVPGRRETDDAAKTGSVACCHAIETAFLLLLFAWRLRRESHTHGESVPYSCSCADNPTPSAAGWTVETNACNTAASSLVAKMMQLPN
jgi:hypothetical protein